MRPQMYDTTKPMQENIENALRGVYDEGNRIDNEQAERKLDDSLNKLEMQADVVEAVIDEYNAICEGEE